jgi:hypothetical protein
MIRARIGRAACACLLLTMVLTGCGRRIEEPPRLDPALRDTLQTWLAEHGTGTLDYVVGLFDTHDVVLLGEVHYVKQNVVFVHSLLQPLYRAGVRTLAIEFARREDQGRVDSLLAAPEWHEDLARAIVFDQFVEWGYQEYVDIFRAAWELNRALPPGAPPFRVLGINDSPDWSLLRTSADLDNGEIKARVWRGGGERYWAQTVLDAVAAGQKVLVYSGIHHAFTAYRQPVVVGGRFVRFDDTRMGNYVYRAIGKRAVTVFLHAPWAGARGYDDKYVHPADGHIDALMLWMPRQHAVGFDLGDSPFGRLRVRNAVYANGYPDFRLGQFCDGWIYSNPISEYTGVTPIPDWIRPDNLDRARRQTPYLRARGFTADQFKAMIARNADLKRRWGGLR